MKRCGRFVHRLATNLAVDCSCLERVVTTVTMSNRSAIHLVPNCRIQSLSKTEYIPCMLCTSEAGRSTSIAAWSITDVLESLRHHLLMEQLQGFATAADTLFSETCAAVPRRAMPLISKHRDLPSLRAHDCSWWHSRKRLYCSSG